MWDIRMGNDFEKTVFDFVEKRDKLDLFKKDTNVSGAGNDPMLEAGIKATMGTRYKQRPPDYMDMLKMVYESGGNFVLDRSSWEHPRNKEKYTQWLDAIDTPITAFLTKEDYINELNKVSEEGYYSLHPDDDPNKIIRLNTDDTLRDFVNRARTSMQDVLKRR